MRHVLTELDRARSWAVRKCAVGECWHKRVKGELHCGCHLSATRVDECEVVQDQRRIERAIKLLANAPPGDNPNLILEGHHA